MEWYSTIHQTLSRFEIVLKQTGTYPPIGFENVEQMIAHLLGPE